MDVPGGRNRASDPNDQASRTKGTRGASNQPDEYMTIRVRDVTRVVEFEGRLLAEVSTTTPVSVRWTEMALYKTRAGRYVLSIVGCSDVYHRHDSPCNSGVPTRAYQVPEDAKPCGVCTPPKPYEGEQDRQRGTTVTDSTMFDVEEDRPTVYVCDTPKSVMERLRDPRGVQKWQTQPPMSGPAHRLVTAAADHDAGIMAEITTVERL